MSWTYNLLAVFIGGGIGSVLRYLVGFIFIQKLHDSALWPTFTVNFIGSFLFGLLLSYFYKSSGDLNQPLTLLFTVGLCGGFTTFSAFSLEGVMLIKEGQWQTLVIYSLGSVILGFLSAFAGWQLIAK